MKFHTDRVDIERGGIEGEKAFSIKTTAKAFDILSSGLYTDRILAIVRELSCNAWDSHVEAGKEDEPFIIHLPNRLEPWFSVIDNGIGLDHDGVVNLYTTYFDSTKSDSNKFIGALGLGSKSPFSYTKSFEVIARFNGKKRTYTAFINEEGVPTIAKMGGDFDTDECNGVEVKLTIQSDDFYKFKDRTANALMWFPVKPKVVGDPHFRFATPPESTLTGDRWAMHKKQYGDHALTAVQGNIAYRVDLMQLDEFNQAERDVLRNQQLILFCDIGDLEVAASREEIRYDKRTKEAIVRRATNVLQLFRTQIEEEAAKYPNSDWDAYLALTQLSVKLFHDDRSLAMFMSRTAKGDVLKRYLEHNRHAFSFNAANGMVLLRYTNGKRYGAGVRLSRKKIIPGHIRPSSRLAFFVNDMPSGGVARMTEYVQQTKGIDELFVITFKDNPQRTMTLPPDSDGTVSPGLVLMTEEEVQEEFAQLIKDLGNPKVLKVSEDAPAVQRERLPRSTPIYRFGGTYSANSSRSWSHDKVKWHKVKWQGAEDDNFNPDEGGLYFLLKHRSHVLYTNIAGDEEPITWSAEHFGQNLTFILQLIEKHYKLPFATNNTEHVFAVGAQARKHVEGRDGWYDMFGLLRDIIPHYADEIVHLNRMDNSSNTLSIREAIESDAFVAEIKKLPLNSRFRNTVLPMVEAKQKHANGTNAKILRCLIWADHYVGSGLFTNDIQPYIQQNPFVVHYPMLEFVSSFKMSYHASSETTRTIFDYINLIDQKEEC